VAFAATQLSASTASTTSLQAPTDPSRLQALQEPSQAVEQQTPSRQKPDEHAASMGQTWPLLRLGEQVLVPESQKKPVEQSDSPMHWTLHFATPHT
jgi:hypothetical protein